MRHALPLALVVLVGCSAARGSDEPWDDEPNPDDVERSAESITLAEGLDAEELAFFRKINEYRQSKGVAPLQVSVALTRAAEFHSTDMASKNYFSHDSQDGTSFSTRVKRWYSYATWLGENIAAGNGGGLATFEQWKASPGHEANMVKPEFKVVGIARAYSATSTYKWYWTTDFGGHVDEVMTEGSAPPPPPPPSNLLTDGGFESGTLKTGVGYGAVRTLGVWHASWSSGGSVAQTSAAAASGARGLRVVDPDPGSVNASQLVAIAAGTTYRLTAKARRPSGNSRQSVWIDFLDASYANLGRTRGYATSNTTWSTVTVTATAPSNAKYARVVVYGSSYSGYRSSYDWDDVALVAQ